MLRKEPALVVAVLVALAQAVAIFVTGDPNVKTEWLYPILTVFAGALTRTRVTPNETVRQAGFTPSEIQQRAADPNVPPAPKGSE